jgi:hypothetical protein
MVPPHGLAFPPQPQHFSFWNRTRPQDHGILNSSTDIALCYGINYILVILFFFAAAVIAAAIHVVASFASSS